ncbi:MAG: site-specific DNA-methyltransferase [Planctomycetes bacterium]|nr:site-specific DNA-methyltransferase [Planctomycetota bacterium]
MGKQWDHGVPSVEVWSEVLRVLKPGAMLMAFGGTRTHHRLACAIEDAGFELRDCMMWLYGSGFPKSHNISKGIDKQAGAEREVLGVKNVGLGNKRGDGFNHAGTESGVPVTGPATDDAKTWDGYGTALKPAWEPVILAMKPIDGTFAENALKHGVAGMNIAEGRIPGEPWTFGVQTDLRGGGYGSKRPSEGDIFRKNVEGGQDGRWPANLILDDESAEALDDQAGVRSSGKMKAGTVRKNRAGFTGNMPTHVAVDTPGDSGGASRFFYCAKADRSERNAGLKGKEKRSLNWSSGEQSPGTFQSEGTDRTSENFHPTVKPIDLCRYLAALTLPPATGQPRKLLVPYSGSGSEILGAYRAGWDKITGIEKDGEYIHDIAIHRIKHETKQGKMF